MGSRPRAILFSAFPNEGYVSSDTTTGLVDANTENIVTRRGGVYSRLHAPLHFSPVLPINQVLLMIGGYTLTVPLHLV